MNVDEYWDKFKDPFLFMEFFHENEYCQKLLGIAKEKDGDASEIRYAGGVYSCADKYPGAFGNIRTMYMEWRRADLYKLIDKLTKEVVA